MFVYVCVLPLQSLNSLITADFHYILLVGCMSTQCVHNWWKWVCWQKGMYSGKVFNLSPNFTYLITSWSIRSQGTWSHTIAYEPFCMTRYKICNAWSIIYLANASVYKIWLELKRLCMYVFLISLQILPWLLLICVVATSLLTVYKDREKRNTGTLWEQKYTFKFGS